MAQSFWEIYDLLCKMWVNTYIPDAPCMEYLPTIHVGAHVPFVPMEGLYVSEFSYLTRCPKSKNSWFLAEKMVNRNAWIIESPIAAMDHNRNRWNLICIPIFFLPEDFKVADLSPIHFRKQSHRRHQAGSKYWWNQGLALIHGPNLQPWIWRKYFFKPRHRMGWSHRRLTVDETRKQVLTRLESPGEKQNQGSYLTSTVQLSKRSSSNKPQIQDFVVSDFFNKDFQFSTIAKHLSRFGCEAWVPDELGTSIHSGWIKFPSRWFLGISPPGIFPPKTHTIPHHASRDSNSGNGTVDGRNPAPVDMVNIPLFIRFHIFMHVGWSRISSINSMGVVWEWRCMEFHALDMVLQEIFDENKLLIHEWWFLEAGPRCTNRTKIFDGVMMGVFRTFDFCQLQSPFFAASKPVTSPENSPFFFWKNDTWKMMHFFSKCSLWLGTNSFIFRGGNGVTNSEPLSWSLGLLKKTHDLDEILQVHSSLIWWKSHPIRLLDIEIVVLEGQHTSAYIYIHVYTSTFKGGTPGVPLKPFQDDELTFFRNHLAPLSRCWYT